MKTNSLKREIKFRGWDSANNRMIPHELLEVGLKNINKSGSHASHITYLQYTGLLDKHLKEIYEGDIVEFHNRLYEVCINFNGYYLQRYKLWRGQFKPAFCYEMSLFTLPTDRGRVEGICKEAEVIGNIFENPQLLGKIKETA